jgi:hypothetical protein
MSEEKETPKEPMMQVARLFEQPSDATSFYADYGQVMHTGNEIIVQFYETIPGPPDPGGSIRNVRSRLRATIILSPSHARNIGKLLVERTQQIEKTEEAKK